MSCVYRDKKHLKDMYEQIYKSTDDGSPSSSLQLHTTANASANANNSNNSHAPQSYSKLHVQTTDSSSSSASQQVCAHTLELAETELYCITAEFTLILLAVLQFE
jgi:hypothetical protein